jgi:hypothetical protein
VQVVEAALAMMRLLRGSFFVVMAVYANLTSKLKFRLQVVEAARWR